MKGRSLPEDFVESLRLHGGDPLCIETADSAAELQRSREGLLERHLLVEHKPDQQGQRVADEEAVRLNVAGEGKSIDRHGRMIVASHRDHARRERCGATFPPQRSRGLTSQMHIS